MFDRAEALIHGQYSEFSSMFWIVSQFNIPKLFLYFQFFFICVRLQEKTMERLTEIYLSQQTFYFIFFLISNYTNFL